MNADGSGQTRITNTSGSNGQPNWGTAPIDKEPVGVPALTGYWWWISIFVVGSVGFAARRRQSGVST